MPVILLVLAVICLTFEAQAQESKPKAPPPAAAGGVDAAPLITALEVVMKRDGTAFAGKASRQEAEGEPDKPGERSATEVRVFGANGGGFSGMGGFGRDAFSGAFELVIPTDGESLILTQAALPGFTVYSKGARTLTRTNSEKTQLDSRSLPADLAPLIKVSEIVEAIKKAKLKSAAVDGGTLYRGELPGLLQRPPRDANADGERQPWRDFGPRVLRVRSEFRLDAENHLKMVKLMIVRSDPMAGMRRRMRETTSDGSGTFVFSANSDDAPEPNPDEEGPTTVYELTLSADGASARARDELEAARTILGK